VSFHSLPDFIEYGDRRGIVRSGCVPVHEISKPSQQTTLRVCVLENLMDERLVHLVSDRSIDDAGVDLKDGLSGQQLGIDHAS